MVTITPDTKKKLQKLWVQFTSISEPIRLGTAKSIIIHKGIKLSKIRRGSEYKITVEDTSFDDYSPIINPVILDLLLNYAIRQEKIIRAKEDCKSLERS